MFFYREYTKIFLKEPLQFGTTVSFVPGEATPTKLREWAEHLQSGQYTQGFGVLKDILGNNVRLFCCLGVLADINEPFCYLFRKEVLAAEQFKKFLDIKNYTQLQFFFAYMNDDLGYSFNQIGNILIKLADFIESGDKVGYIE